MQLRQGKSHLLSSTTAETFKHQGSSRSFLSNLWYHIRLHHYRFETTFGPYVMDSGEKFVFYLIFFFILLSVIMLVYYALSFLVSRTVPSIQSTLRELVTNEIPKLRRVDAVPMPMASRKSYSQMDNTSAIVAPWRLRDMREERPSTKSIEDQEKEMSTRHDRYIMNPEWSIPCAQRGYMASHARNFGQVVQSYDCIAYLGRHERSRWRLLASTRKNQRFLSEWKMVPLGAKQVGFVCH